MRLMSKMLVLAAASTVALGCGDTDSECGDGGCPDGSVTTSDAIATSDTAMQWGLSPGTNDFNVTSVAKIETDGCGIGPAALVGMSRPVTYSMATPATVSIGTMTGSPPQPSLGSGPIAGNMATLSRNNREGEANATCFWTQKIDGILTLINHDEFTYDVTLTQSGIAAACSPKPATDPCTSKWQWTFKKK
jgi:hypothetical protein